MEGHRVTEEAQRRKKEESRQRRLMVCVTWCLTIIGTEGTPSPLAFSVGFAGRGVELGVDTVREGDGAQFDGGLEFREAERVAPL